jgi:hypothetical protein
MTLKHEPNFAHGYNFLITIPELPIISELAQDFLLPALTLNPAEVPNRFVDYGIPGEKLVYTELDIGFIMDSNMDAYVEIHNWMRLMAGTIDQPVEQRKELVSDITLHILNNAKNQVRKFIFTDAWPTSLGAVSYDLLGADVTKSILSMKFTNFKITPADSDVSMFTDKVYETDIA